ncbi:heat shock protein DnaJ with tetratricopeptiderepeat [Striga asiatica]|uniref:Heat shock protein DnaJ with tetratricopeptiderepeat n=1 Tax=Striga asiatica TaxID=4170 RepID=A0A5A7R4W0_STRAF|nr:heat shock protein DnaJ with tetratricopeptiderepeat [Striga asiatica]
MSPPIISPHPLFDFPNPNLPSTQNSEKLEFVSGSGGGGKSISSNRTRPRLTKLRRKEMSHPRYGKSVKIDFLSSSDGGVSVSSTKGGSISDMKEKTESFVFAFGDNDGAKLNEGKEDESQVSGDCSDDSTANQNLPDEAPVFGPSRTGIPVYTDLESSQFAFVIGTSNPGRNSNFVAKDSGRFKARLRVDGFKKSNNPNVRVPLSQQDSFKPCSNSSVDEFQEVSSSEFVFSARTNPWSSINPDARKQDSENVDNRGFKFRFSSGADSCKNLFKNNDSSVMNSKFQKNINPSGFSEEGPAFGLSDALKGLNINASEAKTKKTESLTSNFSVNGNNVFVFGRDEKISGTGKENQTMNEKGPYVFCSSEINSEPNSKSFATKPAGLGSFNACFGTPNTTFSIPTYNFLPGLGTNFNSANSKSLRGNRLKKKTGKSRPNTVVQQLFGQDRVTKESNSVQNQESPGFGSPMDFSPYQNSNARGETEADTSSAGVKGIFTLNEKDASSEHLEKSDYGENDSYFSPPFTAQDGLSSIRSKYKKKYKSKVGLNHEKENAKQDAVPNSAHEACEHWRIKGNQAYHEGKLSKAEEFYSTGINVAPRVDTPGHSLKPLLLCYSNRAATRMSLGRMREAIGDCKKATDLDPNFLKVTLRAGNCYLVLGEVENAIECYSKCLSFGTDVCLDRRITVEAADCLQKAKKVAEHIDQSSKLLQENNSNSTSTALKNISEALSISRFSERLLQMKGEALCSLRMYDEVIKLCDQTHDIAKKNFGADFSDDENCKFLDVNFWRLHLQSKSYFHLGRLDLALELIEKREKIPGSSRLRDSSQESSIALGATIRELLSLKKLGNEAFSCGKYTEAIEKYTSAISKSSESRSFMAICFCNRAAAYQSINQVVDAIADCSLAIALDENYQKAISRRATLHEMIRDYKQAVYDLQRLISLLESQSQTKSQQLGSQSKSNGGSVRDLRKARRHLTALEEKAKKETPLDLYLILGIKATDAESEIKKAYRKAALRHHPDKVLVRSDVGDGGTLWKDFGEKIHEDADRLFKVIGEAYAVLSDPSKRAKYDNEEEIRNIYKESSRNSNSGYPSTSYNSSFERGNWYGKQTSSSTSSERNSNRRYWYESRSYGYSHSRW